MKENVSNPYSTYSHRKLYVTIHFLSNADALSKSCRLRKFFHSKLWLVQRAIAVESKGLRTYKTNRILSNITTTSIADSSKDIPRLWEGQMRPKMSVPKS